MAQYRLYHFNPRTHGIVSFEIIEADTDEAALSLAEKEKGVLALELWNGARKVASFEATDFVSQLLARRMARSSEGNEVAA